MEKALTWQNAALDEQDVGDQATAIFDAFMAVVCSNTAIYNKLDEILRELKHG